MDVGAVERDAERDAETRWLSYQQIASIRGISRASAARMARLHRWPRRRNNAGVTVCAVPLAYAEPDRPAPAEHPAGKPPESVPFPAESAAISALHSAIDVLRNQLVRAESRGDRLQAELDGLRQEAQAAAQRAERLEAADAARRGQGRWARARRAWRGE